ncbi:ATP-NAD kinase-like domain-containing protein [Melanogaster broomeanus]|nr:ATP-NAD kinase-like domain-containing protein [Melanogaster broomeanus]
MPILVIYNPASGDCTAQQLFHSHVIPRLHSANAIPTEVIPTRGPGHAGVEVINFLEKYGGDTTVVLGSGDGTLHEIINQLMGVSLKGARQNVPSSAVHLVLVPCGTANALYSSMFKRTPEQDAVAYKLRSLEAFLIGSTPKLLTLAFTSLSGPPASQQTQSRVVLSAVVTSTALHAAILEDSERLRKEIPGIERFKVAAQQNITKWYSSCVKLLPMPSSGVVHIYDPDEGDFVPHDDSSEDNPILDVYGPFAYFLSTVNVDRLEPEFRITPMTSKSPALDASMDVVMVRPQRDPTFGLDTPQARQKFAGKAVAVLTAAYQDGNHINLRYSENGDITEGGTGKTVVECLPDDIDERAHLLCSDGTIFTIEKGGRAVCKAALPTDNTGFLVHV